MTAQHLFDPGEATGAMTPAQTLVWQHVQDSGSQGGLTPTQAGRLIHAASGAHAEADTCVWCKSAGKGVLENLKARRLVKRRKTGVYQPVRRPDASFGDFPAGF